MSKANMKIHTTTDYDQFKYIAGNRDVVEAHVKSLSEQITIKDFQIPIIVNEKMEVCEGQHRLEAYKALSIPITYIIKEGLDIFFICLGAYVFICLVSVSRHYPF